MECAAEKQGNPRIAGAKKNILSDCAAHLPVWFHANVAPVFTIGHYGLAVVLLT
jgi:hypothetical protein